DSQPATAANAGQPYQYQAAAHDPDGVAVSYLLYKGPAGMTVDARTGLVSWLPTPASPAQAAVVLQAYDIRGGRVPPSFTVTVGGVSLPPAFDPLAVQFTGQEGQLLEIPVHATDTDGDPLVYWADGLPPGAVFDTSRQTLTWTPGPQTAGTYAVR